MLTREYLHEVKLDPDRADADVIGVRPHVGKDFSDKLGAAERWLRSRVGQPWRTVEGEILRLFDTRNLAGRHIVFCHLLPRKWESPRSGWRVRRRVFFEDDEGRLAVEDRDRHRRILIEPGPLPCRAKEWADGRRVGFHGARAYWYVRSRPVAPGIPPRFRQHHELDDGEMVFYRTLGPTARGAIALVPPRARRYDHAS
jgi:hypothetical protein